MSISRALAKFIAETKYEDIPAYVIETQKKSIIDAIGITLGASGLGYGCQEFVEMAEEMSAGGDGEATVIGFNKKLPAVMAAFANGAMAHSLDFGDTQMEAQVHSNSSSFPAALALAEMLDGVDGKKLLTALVVGSEVSCRVSAASNVELNKYGFYPPTIYSSYGATAAACKMLDLTEDQIVSALSFNLCQTTCSSELINSNETVIRSVRESFSARNGIVSALAAKKGLKGFAEPLEGKYGFYHAYTRGDWDEAKAIDKLGEYWYAGTLYFKLWPSCAGTHPAIKGILQVINEKGVQPVDMEHIHVVVSERCRMLVEPDADRKAPTTSIIGKFSIPYSASVAAVKGNVGLGDFMPEAFKDEAVLSMAQKFTYEVNEDWGVDKAMCMDITVDTTQGEKVSLHMEDDPADVEETSMEQLVAKMKLAAAFALYPKSDEELDAIVAAVQKLDEMENILELTKLL